MRELLIKFVCATVECSGYMAPEYAWNGQFSVKSDVFSFGVLVLEIVTGQKNNRAQTNKEIVETLVNYVSTTLCFWPIWRKFSVIRAYEYEYSF